MLRDVRELVRSGAVELAVHEVVGGGGASRAFEPCRPREPVNSTTGNYPVEQVKVSPVPASDPVVESIEVLWHRKQLVLRNAYCCGFRKDVT